MGSEMCIRDRYNIANAHVRSVKTGVLFGSRVRADALEALALTSAPISAYRVARSAGAEPIQVLTILKALQPDLVRRTPDGWVMVNEPLRRFFRDLVASRDAERRVEKNELLVSLGFELGSEHGRS